MSSWSNLADDLLINIFSILSLIDQIRCGAVCMNWKRLIKGVRPADKLPWQIHYDWRMSDDGCNYSVCKLFIPSHQETCTVEVQNAFNGEEWRNFVGAEAQYSRYGWVLFCKTQSDLPSRTAFLFAFSPFTNETFRLPELDLGAFENPVEEYQYFGFSLRKSGFSSNPGFSDTLFFALSSSPFDHTTMISTCHRGDATWKSTKVTGVYGEAKDAIYLDEILYCLFGWGTFGAFNVANQRWSCLHKSHIRPPDGVMDVDWNYLVMVDGRFLRLVTNRENGVITIWRFDFSRNNWVKQASLGDYAAFVGWTSFLIPAMGEISEFAGTANHRVSRRIYSFKTGKRMDKPLEIYTKAPKELHKFFVQLSEL